MSWIQRVARPDIVAMPPVDLPTPDPALERLDANELPWRLTHDDSAAGLNRYPEPQPRELIERLAALYDVAPAALLVARGSDEVIDLLVRGFCRAGEDAVLTCPPTFSQYARAARLQGARLVSVPLGAQDFALDTEAVLRAATPDVKLVFLCSPNNPTGNLLCATDLLRVADAFAERALVVVDEAYIEFSGRASLARQVRDRPQLAVLRTLSKAHGLAGARCGALIADPEVIALLRKVIAPYPVSELTTEAVLKLLEPAQLIALGERIGLIGAERQRLLAAFASRAGVRRVWPSDANFILVRFADAGAALARAAAAGLLVRDMRGHASLPEALRITVGTPLQNDRLLEAWR